MAFQGLIGKRGGKVVKHRTLKQEVLGSIPTSSMEGP